MSAEKRPIPFVAKNNDSNVVVGLRRHGKTYAMLHSLAKAGSSVFFFNANYEDVPKGFITADGRNGLEQILGGLRRGRKISFRPTLRKRQAQLRAIIAALYAEVEDGKRWNMEFVVDEVPQYTEIETIRSMEMVSMTGNKFGIRPSWIGQSPADIPYSLMKQSTRFIIFKTHMEDEYLHRKRFPVDEIKKRLYEGGKYAYVIYDFEELKGPYKV